MVGIKDGRNYKEWPEKGKIQQTALGRDPPQGGRMGHECCSVGIYGVRSPKFIWTPCVQLYSLAETRTPPSPHIWAHIRGRYWSAKIDNIS